MLVQVSSNLYSNIQSLSVILTQVQINQFDLFNPNIMFACKINEAKNLQLKIVDRCMICSFCDKKIDVAKKQ